MISKQDLSGVFAALNAQPARAPGAGRALMLISARRGEGVSAFARAAARVLSTHTTYAIDLDVRRNGLARALAAEGAKFGPKCSANLGGAQLFEAIGADGRVIVETAPLFSLHRLEGTQLFVGGFDAKALPAGARVRMCDAAKFWSAARANGASVVVDAPSLERSPIGLRAARHMDGVVFVVGDGDGAAPAALDAKARLLSAGANLIGLVYARARPLSGKVRSGFPSESGLHS